MQSGKNDLLAEVADYYSKKLIEHGETPKGVDWNGKESQTLRFEQLTRLIDSSKSFSIADIGCGYGAFYHFLSDKYAEFSYLGMDISPEMVQAAKRRFLGQERAQFKLSGEFGQLVDYAVASGIFNVRLGSSDEEWLNYLEATLNILDKSSEFGFAFNCLTSYSDAEKKRDHLYYADPSFLFDLCKRRYSRNVALLHDYDLYEFTILVRKLP